MHFVVEFKDNGTHLPNLTKALVGGILGKLTPVPVAPKLGQAGELFYFFIFYHYLFINTDNYAFHNYNEHQMIFTNTHLEQSGEQMPLLENLR